MQFCRYQACSNWSKKELFSVPTKSMIQQAFLSDTLLAMEMKRTQIHINKPAYSGLSILEMTKLIIYRVWYNYVKPKYGKKIFHINKNSFYSLHKKQNVILQTMN